MTEKKQALEYDLHQIRINPEKMWHEKWFLEPLDKEMLARGQTYFNRNPASFNR